MWKHQLSQCLQININIIICMEIRLKKIRRNNLHMCSSKWETYALILLLLFYKFVMHAMVDLKG